MLALYCGDREVAEDLAQETLLRLCRDWGRVRNLDNPQAWLHRVAINLAHSHYRRKAIERRITGLLPRRDADSESPTAEVETLELLRPLPHKQRVALLLHYYVDMSVADVARVMRLPEGTVKTLIHRGSHRLRTSTPSQLEVSDVV